MIQLYRFISITGGKFQEFACSDYVIIHVSRSSSLTELPGVQHRFVLQKRDSRQHQLEK